MRSWMMYECFMSYSRLLSSEEESGREALYCLDAQLAF